MQKRPSGFANPWLQLALSVACVLVSEFLLKRGATEVANTDSAWSWTGVNGLASPLVWWAILLIIASFISWLYVLRYIPITIAFPLSRVVDILVPLGCWIFLGELISPLRWCGIALVDCWAGVGCETDRTIRGTPVSFLAFLFIVVSLVSFVAAQLILKRAMEASRTTGFRNAQFVSKVTGGIILMTISFFLTLGLLQRFDLSYLYPFQGLSVIFITLMAAVVLKEKLNLRLAIGALLISIGIVLVSLS